MSLIHVLQSLKDKQKQRLFNANNIDVYQYKQYRYLTIAGNAIQSIQDINNPAILVSPVNKMMLCGLSFLPKPKRCLILGSGGGSFEQCLSVYDNKLQIDSVEASQEVIDIAKRFFQFPTGIKITCQDAEHYVSNNINRRKQVDLIFCDIFNGQKHPACLLDKHYYQNIKQHLSEQGVLIINLLGDNEKELQAIILLVRQVFAYSAIAAVNNCNNAILYASQSALKIQAIEKPSLLNNIDIDSHIEAIKILPKFKRYSPKPANDLT